MNTHHSDTGEKEKFAIDAAEFPMGSDAALPDFYGEDRLVAMARDPRCLFAYWEITPTNHERARRESGADVWDVSALVLRAYDVTSQGHGAIESCPFFDVEVHRDARQWYVLFERSGGLFVLDLGLRHPDGRFFSLLRSNAVRLPGGRVSDAMDSQFAAVRVAADGDPLAFLNEGLDRIGRGSAEFSKSMALRWEFLRSVFSGGQAPSSHSSAYSGTLPSSARKTS